MTSQETQIQVDQARARLASIVEAEQELRRQRRDAEADVRLSYATHAEALRRERQARIAPVPVEVRALVQAAAEGGQA